MAIGLEDRTGMDSSHRSMSTNKETSEGKKMCGFY